MKQGLSKREKILIGIMAVVVIVFVSFQFGITPAYNNYSSKSEEYYALSSTKKLMEIKLLSKETVINAYNTVTANYNTIEKHYPVYISNEAVDNTLTGLCKSAGLEPISLNISEVASGTTAREGNGTSNAANASDTSDTGESVSETSVNSDAFSTVTASMTLNGNYNGLKRLIKKIHKMSYIRINKVSFTDPGKANAAVTSNVSIVFEMTMLNETALVRP